MTYFPEAKYFPRLAKSCSFSLGILLLAALLGGGPAWAHKVTVFAWVEGNRIYTESQFSGGRKVNHGKIQVFDDKDKMLLEGVTDDQGAFDFEIPKVCDLKIVLIAGMGHQNQWIVPADEIREAAGLPAGTKPEEPVAQKQEHAQQEQLPAPAAQILTPEIEKQLEKILDRKLHPLVRQLAEMQNRGPNLQDILGGIGYILGLVGLGAYFNYRRKTKEGSK